MYSADQLVEGARNPHKIVEEVRDWGLGAYLETVGRHRQRRAIDVMAADWDNLLILDACRYDLFESVHTLPGDLRKVVSRGTGTDEFLKANVDGGEFPDVVYLTANPHLHFVDARFHDVWKLWETDWDDELDTVRPENIVERTLSAHERYPNKRLVSHFVQPHYPFIGETGRELEARDIEIRGFLEDTTSIFQHLDNGTVKRERVWAAYRENLELTLPHVRRLIEALPGKTVVTSDHGNAFGEWGITGHGGPKIPALVDVPWLTVDGADRKQVKPGKETVSSLDLAAVDGGGVEDRLADLGYA
jgi:hypothetical protein